MIAGTLLNVNSIRVDFSILDQEVHPGKRLIFFDSAASSQKPRQVIEVMDAYYRYTHANVHRGVYSLSESATELFEVAREKVRKFINAGSRREIIFTRNATESMNLIVQSWGRANLRPGDVVVLSEMEHHANIVPWQMLAAEKGFTLRYVPITEDFTLDMEALASILRDTAVKVVSLTHVSNVMGTVNPIEEIVRMAHAAGALAIVDGAQSAPHMPVDLQAMDADFYVFSSHKMCGPTGIGVLYGKRHLLEAMPPFMGGGDMIRRVTLEGSTWNELPYKFEAGTPAIAEAIGLGAAIDYLNRIGMDSIHIYEQQLGGYAAERLSEVSGLHLYNPPAPYRSGVATFTLDRVHAHDLAQILDTHGVAVRAGHHCAMPLHQRLQVPATARASFYLYNTLEEIDRLVEALEDAKSKFS